MDESPNVEVEHISHLGIVAAIVKQYKLVQTIDSILPKISHNKKLTHGQTVLAMIYMGLGFSNRRFYLAKDFFADRPLEQLFGPGVSIDMFNDDTFARTLDAIFKYGPKMFYANVAFKTMAEHKVLFKFALLDTTSVYYQGRTKNKPGNIELTYGYSKDHRRDLPQLIQLLASTENGLPFWSETFSGNANDREILQNGVIEVQKFLDEITNHHFIFVADSSLFDKSFILNKKIKGEWISRVPESIKMARTLLEKEYDRILWTKMNKDYKYTEFERDYGGKKQRWILVRNREAKYKELATFKKNLDNEEKLIKKNIKKLQKRIFYSKEEIQVEIDKLKKYHPNFRFTRRIAGVYERRKGHKRRFRIGWEVIPTVKRNSKRIQLQKNKKGKFILSTNVLDRERLPTEEVINVYKGRNANIEGLFKTLKDPIYRLNEIYLKRVDRIEASMAVMSLVLFVNNIGQVTLRTKLKEGNTGIPNQIGKSTDNPTMKWAFHLLRKVIKVKVRVAGRIYEEFKGLSDAQEIIINCFGDYARKIYGHT